MRLLLFGTTGQLGWELNRILPTLGELTALDYPDIDFSRAESVRQVIRSIRPHVIVNAAAFTAVDRAENEPDSVYAINSDAPGIIASEAKAIGSAFVHYSTDYVFDGTKGEPYTEQDTPNPINVYGKSKLAGEQAIEQTGGSYLILRTSLLYSLRGESFVTNVLKWSRQQETMRIVTDQVSNPTWCRMLAEVTTQVLASGHRDIAGWLAERSGMYHCAGDGYASRFEWAREILKHDPHRKEQVVKSLQAAQTADFPTPAQRPLFSALNCDHFHSSFKMRLPDWKYAMKLAMNNS